MNEFFAELDGVAPVLNALKKSPDADFIYAGLCDGILWSDELVTKLLDDNLTFKYLLRYRTSIIEGKLLQAIQPYWDYAKKTFPNWPGFSPERCTPSAELSAKIRELRAEFEDIWIDS